MGPAAQIFRRQEVIHATGLYKIPLNLIQRGESGFVLSCKSAITYLYTGFVWQRKQAMKDNKIWIPISFQEDLFSLVIAQPLKTQKIMVLLRSTINIDRKTESLWKGDNAMHFVRSDGSRAP